MKNTIVKRITFFIESIFRDKKNRISIKNQKMPSSARSSSAGSRSSSGSYGGGSSSKIYKSGGNSNQGYKQGSQRGLSDGYDYVYGPRPLAQVKQQRKNEREQKKSDDDYPKSAPFIAAGARNNQNSVSTSSSSNISSRCSSLTSQLQALIQSGRCPRNSMTSAPPGICSRLVEQIKKVC